jgi:uncharacterized coiled-coil protein SlyX
MSEERLERIENQLGQVLQAMTGLSDRMTRIEDRMTRIEDRVDIMEGTLLTTMRGGFNAKKELPVADREFFSIYLEY